MIDLDWIASQPKPVAIHCPTYHDIMTVLCDTNENRDGGPLSDERIIEITGAWWRIHAEDACVRVKVFPNGKYGIYHCSKSFYDGNPHYILVSIDQVKQKRFDLGEIDADESCLLSLFGMEEDA